MANPRPASPRPEGFPWLLPMLTVRDGAKALDFYESAFGFTRGDVMRDDSGKVVHGEILWRDARVMIAPEDHVTPAPPGGPARPPVDSGAMPPVLLYVYCDDVDALVGRATAAGAGVIQPAEDRPWGDRMASLTDPDGHVWNFATHIGFGPNDGDGA